MRAGLCSNANETYAALSTNLKEIITVENNQIKGLIGHSIDKILEPPDKRKCSVIGGFIQGRKLKNGSYTGNLGLLEKRIADLYLRFEAPLILEPWLEITIPMLTERILVFEELATDGDHEFYDLTTNLNVGFELIFWFTFTLLLFWIFKFALFKYTNRDRTSIRLMKEIMIRLLTDFEDSSTTFRMLSLFYELYIMIVQLLLTNNIKTNKVVVDTSDIIKTQSEMFETKRTACWLEHETEQKIAELFKGSVLNKVLNEKTKLKKPIIDYETGAVIDKCIMKMSFESMQMIDLGDKFSLIRQNTGYVTSAIFSSFKEKNHAWYIGGNPIYEINQVFYYTRYRLTKQFISEIMYQLTEMGFIVRMYDEMNENAKSSFNRKHPLYDNLDDYINENSGFDDLSLENFENIFRFYTIFLLVIVFFFLLFKWLKIYIRSLRNYYLFGFQL